MPLAPLLEDAVATVAAQLAPGQRRWRLSPNSPRWRCRPTAAPSRARCCRSSAAPPG
ncbi:hypothetical protein ACFQY5_07115 [Paeniroseomonas aquatica]|uniref:hypothetical protein n=1 Tax=Paeniroseomonas aquatica TaxID=373043 RepID=UPI0036087BF8